jgi:hypothetical protein
MSYPVNAEGWVYTDTIYRAVTGSSHYYEVCANKIEMVIDYAMLNSFNIEQRYTDQVIELLQRGEGWSISDGTLKHPLSSMIELACSDGSAKYATALSVPWGDPEIIAYRLVTNDLYHKGKRVVLQEGDFVKEIGLSSMEINTVKNLFVKAVGGWVRNESGILYCRDPAEMPSRNTRQLTVAQVLNAENAKPKESFAQNLADKSFQNHIENLRQQDHENDSPDDIEWDGEGLPPAGVECLMWNGVSDTRVALTYIGAEVGCYIKIENGKEYTIAFDGVRFNPIKTEKERVIEMATIQLGYNCKTEESSSYDDLVNLYDAGMLKLPEAE